MKARYIEQKEIVIDQDGIRALEPGDILIGEEGEDEVRQLHGATPKNPDQIWEGGRPLEVITKDKKFIVSRIRAKDKRMDMDSAIPNEILQRRKRLVMDRLKQERGR